MSSSIFERPSFVAPFTDYSSFLGGCIGVTGARGILGRIAVDRLVSAGVSVESFAGDVNDERALEQWFRVHQFSHCFHFAAIVPVTRVESEPLRAYQTNAIGTFNVCKNIVLMQPECWLFHCSSSHIYQPTEASEAIVESAIPGPKTFYGETKLAAERIAEPLLKRLGADYCIGRVFSFSHASQREPYLIPSLAARIAKLGEGESLNVTNPSSVRDIQDAETVVDCILHLARLRAQGVVNIGTGIGLSVCEIATAVANSLGRKIDITGKDLDAPGALIADTARLRTILTQ